MLALAILIDLVNIILGFLDFFIIGLILSPIWNFIALTFLGGWLFARTGQGVRSPDLQKNKRLIGFLAKKIALPFIGNSIPISKFFPWWVWSVWSALDKGASPEPASEEQEERQATVQPQAAPNPA